MTTILMLEAAQLVVGRLGELAPGSPAEMDRIQATAAITPAGAVRVTKA